LQQRNDAAHTEGPGLGWRINKLLQLDAMNLVILVIAVYIIWSVISALIDNPARYLRGGAIVGGHAL
jgi:hypothetical protein